MCTSCNCGDSRSDVVLGVESLTTRAPEVFEVEGMTSIETAVRAAGYTLR